MLSYFLSADWSKCAGKRSVYLADVSKRRIERLAPSGVGWNLGFLLGLAEDLSRAGSVLIGIDVVLGVPDRYWQLVLDDQKRGAPTTFVDWLSSRNSVEGFFETAVDPADWGVDRPFFNVRPVVGGLLEFTNKVQGGMLRCIDAATNGKPVFAVSGIPGTVGSGTRDLWRELIPLLSPDRRFKIWPFEVNLEELLEDRGVGLCETYPALAYAAALADDLPTGRTKIRKTDTQSRKDACGRLEQANWIRRHRVDLGSLDEAKANDDDFDALFTAAAVLRCVLDGAGLVDTTWTDAKVEGSMLLAGPVEPDRWMTGFATKSKRTRSFATSKSVHSKEYRCPIPECQKTFNGSRGGWDSHVGSLRMHPKWHPEVVSQEERRRLFSAEFGDWFK